MIHKIGLWNCLQDKVRPFTNDCSSSLVLISTKWLRPNLRAAADCLLVSDDLDLARNLLEQVQSNLKDCYGDCIKEL